MDKKEQGTSWLGSAWDSTCDFVGNDKTLAVAGATFYTAGAVVLTAASLAAAAKATSVATVAVAATAMVAGGALVAYTVFSDKPVSLDVIAKAMTAE